MSMVPFSVIEKGASLVVSESSVDDRLAGTTLIWVDKVAIEAEATCCARMDVDKDVEVAVKVAPCVKVAVYWAVD